MRELTVRIKFTSPCLGNVKKHYTTRIGGKRKKRTYFVHLRDPQGRVIFLPTWWQAIMRGAAEVLSRYHKEVKELRFALEVDGQPRPIPDELYDRYYTNDRYSRHEAFMAGDTVGISCLVPDSISDDDFWRLMEYAGRYYGISPCRPGEYGFFAVESVERCGLEPPKKEQDTMPQKTRITQTSEQ